MDRSVGASTRIAAATPRDAPPERRGLRVEIILVLGVSLGMSGLYALVNLIGDLTAPTPLNQQQATLNTSQAPGRPWLDLSLQLLGIISAIVPAFLALYLMSRRGDQPSSIGLDRRRPGWDIGVGAGLALVIGVPGLGLYLAAHALGINASIVAESLPNVWWRYPVLVLSALENAGLEEIVVIGYLLTRLEKLGWRPYPALLACAVLRGCYHFYQGFGGFAGNLVMGLVFGWVFQRTRRVLPLFIAHAVIDTVSFIGYALLAGHVSWLPR